MHCRLINFSFILLLLLIAKFGNVYAFAGYKWIPLKSGDKLPENATRIENSANRFIGRARHFDDILPAEVSADGIAFVSSCTSNKIIYKDQFEILTTSDKCEWKTFSYSERIDSIVRVGTAWNNEPIFVGIEKKTDDSNTYERRRYYSSFEDLTDDDIRDTKNNITPIYLTNLNPRSWFDGRSEWQFLSCDINTKWIDSAAVDTPNNTVFGGKSKNGYGMCVAQLKRSCDVITGQVMPEIGMATATLKDGTDIDSAYCQVLVGEPNQYYWVSASGGEIPEYAVVNGLFGYEPEYIAQFNNTIGHLTYREALDQFDYDILVMNQL